MVFSCWECAGKGEINNSIQQSGSAEHRFHTEGRLRIATTSLGSFHCPKQFFPTENHFCLQLSHKDPHFDCYTAHLAQEGHFYYPIIFFHVFDLPAKTAVGMRNTLCTFNLSSHLSRVRGLSGVKSRLICSVLKIIDALPTLVRVNFCYCTSKLKKQCNLLFKI